MAKRPVPMAVKVMRVTMQVLGVILPGVAVNWVYKIWFRAPRYNEPKRETRWRESAQANEITTAYGKVLAYEWGQVGDPVVILVHGWSGRGAQMGAFASPLTSAGYRVIAFDAPAHGASHGSSTTLFRIAEALKQVIQTYEEPVALISHSFGCMVSAYAVRKFQLQTNKLVMISSPTTLNYLIDSFISFLRINKKVEQGFIRKFKAEFGEDVYEQVAADNNLTAWPGELLVVHDKDDTVVDWECSQRFENITQQVRTVYTRQLGHRRILRDKQVIQIIVDFIQGN